MFLDKERGKFTYGKQLKRKKKKMKHNRLMPQNIEAEESIISSILYNTDNLIDLLEILEPKHFYKIAHQKIFAVIVKLFQKNEPIDLITISNMLREKKELEKIGGIAFLTRIIENIPVAPNLVHYANIIREKAILRDLIVKANEIVSNCFENQGSIDEVLNFAEKSIFDVTNDKVKQAFHPISDTLIDTLTNLSERQNNQDVITGVTTGFQQLDTLTSGFQKSDLIILAARPSMGKTAFALNLARNAAFKSNVPVAFFSLEMSKEQLTTRMLCSEARIDSSKARTGYISEKDWDELNNAAKKLSQYQIFIDDSPAITALEIKTKVRRLYNEQKLGLVIIDYLQLMKGRESAERRELAIAEISSALKAIAKEFNIPVIALSQLNRKLEERADKRPILSDLRESGSLEQDADLVMFIYRDDVYNKEENNPKKGIAEILLRKQRNGPTGKIELYFQDAYTRFENLAPEMGGI